MKQVHVDVCI